MTVFQAMILGAVQGLTEFLPISSSGHLVIVPELMDMNSPPLAFDVLLHLATLAAVAGYFAGDIYSMILSIVAPHRLGPDEVKSWRRLTFLLLIGTLPAGLAGVAFGSLFEQLFESTLAVGVFLMVTACLLLLADTSTGALASFWTSFRKPRGEAGQMGLPDALVVGCFQALAIAPGISRSGATMSAAIYLGFDREFAARFSFLLSIPVILGAGLMEFRDLGTATTGGGAGAAYVAGAVAAFVFGLLAVHFLLRFVRSHRLRAFAIYTMVVGGLVIILSLA